MRHDASQAAPRPGELVVVDCEPGVWRLERAVTIDGDACARCFSYVHGRFVVVPVAAIHPCPDLTRAAP